MFIRPLLCVSLILTAVSVCVESVKLGVPNALSVQPPNANIAQRSGPARDYGCFLGLSNNQEETVNKFGESLKWCESTEARSKQELDDDLKRSYYKLSYSADQMCVRIDNDCRDRFALSNDMRGALSCFAEMRKFTLPVLLNITEDSKLKLLTVENLNHTIIANKKECNMHAGFEYIRDSGKNFENFIGCEQPSSDISTTLSTTQSTTQSVIDISSTTPKNDPATWTWAVETTTGENRFPWNK